MLHNDRHGNLGIVIRCVADENGVVDLVIAQLGGAGLGGDLHAVVAEGLIRAAGAVIGDEVHALLHGGPVIVAGLDVAEHLGLIFIDELAAVVAANALEDGRAVARAAVGDRGAVLRQLQRREQAVRLADGRLQRVADVPVRVLELFLHGLRSHLAGALRQLDAGVLAKAEGCGIARERVDRQAVADGVEEDVA